MAIGHVSLADTVSRLVSDFERLNPQTGISVASGPIAYGYGDSVDLTVYRCLQEGITNAQRHADASTIAIELAERPLESDSGSSTALELSIHDDGHGMTPGTQWGFGLTGMDERVRAFGGTVAIKAKPGRGTCLSIRIPVEATRSGSPLLRQNASPET
jgi:two-component system sensor histidine kinase UhpB